MSGLIVVFSAFDRLTAFYMSIIPIGLLIIALFLLNRMRKQKQFVIAFVGAHTMGQGAVVWGFISEIMSNEVQGSGMSFSSGTH